MPKKFFVIFKDVSCISSSLFKKHLKDMATWEIDKADEILVLGGDGLMLSAINEYWQKDIPFCGLNFGHLGFLMNEPTEKNLLEIINGETHSVYPRILKAILTGKKGRAAWTYAFNDFYFERNGIQTANIRVSIESSEGSSKVVFDPLICDGVIVCSQAGSTAYNASAGGVVIPIETEAMVLTGICPAIFHHWKTTPLSKDFSVTLEPLDIQLRPVRFLADGKEIPEIVKATIKYSERKVHLKFAKDKSFREKFLQSQFL